MLEFAKKSFYVGLGLATLTRDKIQTFAKEVAERTKMSEEEGRKFAEYLEQESKKARESLTQNIQQIVDATVGRILSKRKLEELEARIAALEAAVGIEKPAGDTPQPEAGPEESAPSAESTEEN